MPSLARSKSIWGKPLAEGILAVAAVLIFFSVVFGVLRLTLGHTVVDRVVAVDMLTVVSISLIALNAHDAGRASSLEAARG